MPPVPFARVFALTADKMEQLSALGQKKTMIGKPETLELITLRKIYCMLNDVKVVGIDSADFTRNDIKKVYNAAVLDDATVILDTNQIDQLRQSNSLEKTIYHEVIHLFQRQAPDAKIDGLTQIGNSQYIDSFDDTGEVNSLHYLWLYEAFAEYMSMQLNDSKIPLTYKNMVGYLNTLNLITLIRPDYQEDSIAMTMTKCFYRNLAERTANADVTLEDFQYFCFNKSSFI